MRKKKLKGAFCEYEMVFWVQDLKRGLLASVEVRLYFEEWRGGFRETVGRFFICRCGTMRKCGSWTDGRGVRKRSKNRCDSSRTLSNDFYRVGIVVGVLILLSVNKGIEAELTFVLRC